MNQKHAAIFYLVCFAAAALAIGSTPNTLTPEEAKAGWKLLWDGHTTNGWRGLDQTRFPANRWKPEGGTLTVLDSQGRPGGGDIITIVQYTNFELSVDFKLTRGANSGIKYFIDPKVIKGGVGFEYQVLDDAVHPDAKLGTGGNRTLGSLYDLIPAAKDKPVNPVGEWNTALIVVRGKHAEHWLNGRKILEYERGSDDFQTHFLSSKFKKEAKFGTLDEGHILLQDHGNEVSFRNLKIRELPAS